MDGCIIPKWQIVHCHESKHLSSIPSMHAVVQVVGGVVWSMILTTTWHPYWPIGRRQFWRLKTVQTSISWPISVIGATYLWKKLILPECPVQLNRILHRMTLPWHFRIWTPYVLVGEWYIPSWPSTTRLWWNWIQTSRRLQRTTATIPGWRLCMPVTNLFWHRYYLPWRVSHREFRWMMRSKDS